MEWSINESIKGLHDVISARDYNDLSEPIYDRLFQIGIILRLSIINDELEKLNKELDSSIILEGVSIDFDTYLNKHYWFDNFVFKDEDQFYSTFGVDLKKYNYLPTINKMMDYFPKRENEEQNNLNALDTVKQSFYHICERNLIDSDDMRYALFFGVTLMMKQLQEIKSKVNNPQPHQYIKVWNDILDDNKYIEVGQHYFEWKDENEDYRLIELKSQQLFTIFLLLDSGFFRFYTSVTGSEVRNRKLIIDDDVLPIGTKIPDSLPTECAKFEKFIEWKDEYIISINYEKLGKYIYKNYNKLSIDDIENVVLFDKTMDAIHEDMARLKPALSRYLKNYEENMVSELVNSCVTILATCNKHLAEGINESFLRTYIEKLLYDNEMKDEARTKLSNSSKKTFICNIVAVLRNMRIFKVGVDNKDLAHSLHEKINDVLESTLEKNIQRAYNANKGSLYDWTLKNIDAIKQQSSNPFAGII